jgi:glycosyltransferase involved in cell wall biosynthesis
MRRTCVLINNTGLGGAERRFGHLFVRMADADPGVNLVINTGLWKRLVASGVATGHERRVWRLVEPCGRLAEWIGFRRSAPAFFLRKLDYLLFTCLLLVRYALASQRVFHLVLGGAYIALPLMALRPDHRTVISVVSADLRLTVGAPWALPVYRYVLSRCTAIDALTEAARADLMRRGIAGDGILVSPGSAIDPDRFQPAPNRQALVVFAGRLVDEKNPLLFLEAVPAIHRAEPTARFFLLGEGPLRSQVEEALDRSALRGVVEVGFHPDLASVLGKARVFVSLQRQDNYPSQSLLEAMACGAAAVATDVGLTWKLVDEATGIRVKPNPDDIAEAVIRLLRDPQRCDRLGQAARRRVQEAHSEDRYRAYLDELYAKVAM